MTRELLAQPTKFRYAASQLLVDRLSPARRMGENAMNVPGIVLIALALLIYGWFRFGPMRCPACRRLVFGYAGVPVGIRRMQFHCRRCDARFEGHPRLPL
jgi:hypothetical protein